MYNKTHSSMVDGLDLSIRSGQDICLFFMKNLQIRFLFFLTFRLTYPSCEKASNKCLLFVLFCLNINVRKIFFVYIIDIWKYLRITEICWVSISSGGGNRFNKATVITLFSFDWFPRFLWHKNIAERPLSSYI